LSARPDAVAGAELDAAARDPELAILAGRVDALVLRARAARSIAERRFALDALARGLLGADPGTVTPAQRDEARALRVDPSTIAAAAADRLPHAVSVPLVASQRGFGFVRQVHVTFDPVGLGDEDAFDADARHALREAIQAAAGVAAPPSEPRLHRLVAAQPHVLRHARVEGRSLSAAAFVSAAALWTGRPVRADVAVTGELRQGLIHGVGELAAKVRAARVHGFRALVVPSIDRAAAKVARDGGPLEIVGVGTAEELLAVALHPEARPRLDPESAAAEARKLSTSGWRGYQWPSVRERLASLSGTLPSYRLDVRVDVLVRLAAAQRHLGDPSGSLELLHEAESLVRSPEGRRAVPDGPITYLYLQKAMTCRQLGRFGEAARAAARSVAVARSARLRGELVKALGGVGLVALTRRRIDQAVRAFEESLEVTLAHDPHGTARSRAYLVEALSLAGAADAAAAQFEAAMAELGRLPDDASRRSKESWVRTSWGGGLVQLGRAAEAVDVLDRPAVHVSMGEEPLPGLLARRHLGLALIGAGAEERGFELLAASPLVHGRALEPHLALAAHLNVLFEARARLEADAWGPDVLGRARRALDHVPRYVGAFLERPLDATQRLLSRDRVPRRARPLEVLVERCARLIA
jgi:tetratricopeptide (TPR) repeat protein